MKAAGGYKIGDLYKISLSGKEMEFTVAGFDLSLSVISICFVLLAILLAVFLSAKRIYKLYPLSALRGGIETHSFRKNRIPLDRSHGSLSLLMGMKQIVQNAKQSIMIVLIVMLMTFTSVCGISLWRHYRGQTRKPF